MQITVYWSVYIIKMETINRDLTTYTTLMFGRDMGDIINNIDKIIYYLLVMTHN
jgi:hypothetical protein